MSKRFDLFQVLIIIVSILAIGSAAALLYLSNSGKLGRSRINVETANGKAAVVVNGAASGESPVKKEGFFPNEIKVELNGESNSYTAYVSPASATEAYIKHDLGVSKTFSSGQDLWFTKASSGTQTFSIISPDVENVQVLVDGVEVGKTPIKFSTKDLLNKDDKNEYKLTFKKDGYEEQEASVKLLDGYELNIKVNMFLKPVPAEIKVFDAKIDGVSVLNFSKVNGNGFSDRKSWAKAINYWLKTRGFITTGNYKVEKFNYFLTDDGKLYAESGSEIPTSEAKLSQGNFIAYLSTSQSDNLSESALAVLSELSGKKVEASTSGSTATPTGGLFTIEILPNSLGYLRVRDSASSAGKEVSRVDVGKKFAVTQEKSGWYEIEYETGKKGWVSGAANYVKKIPN
ncbi:MAG: PEGA domain-containing protein [Niabella sp.]|nr:MAG: PEGA domain-containing protein [Niabella sp.]